MSFDGEPSILEKLDAAVPAPLAQFDAFPKVPSTYKARSDSRGFLTIFVGLVTFMLMLNDIGEFIFGWPDHEFSVDTVQGSVMSINVDLVVAMPCSCACASFLLYALNLTMSSYQRGPAGCGR